MSKLEQINLETMMIYEFLIALAKDRKNALTVDLASDRSPEMQTFIKAEIKRTVDFITFFENKTNEFKSQSSNKKPT